MKRGSSVLRRAATGQRMTTKDALEQILSGVDVCESEDDEVNLEADSTEEDQSSDEETGPPPKKAKDGSVWLEKEVGARLDFTPIEPYPSQGEPTDFARRRVSSRLQSFLTFITLDMLCTIQEWTNQHGQRTKAEWFLPQSELMAFVSVIISRGLTKVPALRDCWSARFGNPHIARTMSKHRFEDIMRHLRFDDRTTRIERAQTNKFAPISALWGSFVANCISAYEPGRHITVNEQLFPTKVRCRFLQYIASKPDKFGIKFWVACDLQSKYICNVLPYLGKDPNCPHGERLDENVVMLLMHPFLDKGRTVTTDNYFTSLSLARRLLSRKTTLLGTVNKIQREVPESARQTNRDLFSTQVLSTTGATMTIYNAKRKKNVLILSSMHNIIETSDDGKKKPSTLTLYNTTKCGVDIMDQMVREYSVRMPTRRWPVAVFYNMIDMAALNAYVLWQACSGTQERRVDFLGQLAEELAQSHATSKLASKENVLRQQPSTPSPGKRAKCQVKRQCYSNRTTVRCSRCYRYTCGTCEKKIPRRCEDCG